jgi:hypothetical protein
MKVISAVTVLGFACLSQAAKVETLAECQTCIDANTNYCTGLNHWTERFSTGYCCDGTDCTSGDNIVCTNDIGSGSGNNLMKKAICPGDTCYSGSSYGNVMRLDMSDDGTEYSLAPKSQLSGNTCGYFIYAPTSASMEDTMTFTVSSLSKGTLTIWQADEIVYSSSLLSGAQELSKGDVVVVPMPKDVVVVWEATSDKGSFSLKYKFDIVYPEFVETNWLWTKLDSSKDGKKGYSYTTIDYSVYEDKVNGPGELTNEDDILEPWHIVVIFLFLAGIAMALFVVVCKSAAGQGMRAKMHGSGSRVNAVPHQRDNSSKPLNANDTTAKKEEEGWAVDGKK